MIINNTKKNTTISGCSCSSSEFNAHENKFYSLFLLFLFLFESNRIGLLYEIRNIRIEYLLKSSFVVF